MPIVQQGFYNRQIRIDAHESYLHRLSKGASNTINQFIKAGFQCYCRHPETAWRTLDNKLYTECLICGKESKGIRI